MQEGKTGAALGWGAGAYHSRPAGSGTILSLWAERQMSLFPRSLPDPSCDAWNPRPSRLWIALSHPTSAQATSWRNIQTAGPGRVPSRPMT